MLDTYSQQKQRTPQQQKQLTITAPHQTKQNKITLQTPDLCSHPMSVQITIPDGAGGEETACGACGMVKGVWDVIDDDTSYSRGEELGGSKVNVASITPDPKSTLTINPNNNRPNLYLELSVGGRPDRTLRGEKYVRKQSDLGCVSNIAQKLGVPNHVSMDVWRWYHKLREQLRLTKSKCLVLAFCRVCRGRGHPIDESKLLECVKMELGVRHAYTYLRVIMEASSHLEDGEMVLRKMGFLNVGDDDNVINEEKTKTSKNNDHNSSSNAVQYHLGREITALSQKHTPATTKLIALKARDILPGIINSEKNARRAARIAVKMAERRVCGNKIMNTVMIHGSGAATTTTTATAKRNGGRGEI